ncbi:hypothetical protein OV320_7805 [Actinobacteria bacterium OV320]|nr:hypothetical protein OV320_7805 [Actinobacteria bacterium OV320]
MHVVIRGSTYSVYELFKVTDVYCFAVVLLLDTNPHRTSLGALGVMLSK